MEFGHRSATISLNGGGAEWPPPAPRQPFAGFVLLGDGPPQSFYLRLVGHSTGTSTRPVQVGDPDQSSLTQTQDPSRDLTEDSRFRILPETVSSLGTGNSTGGKTELSPHLYLRVASTELLIPVRAISLVQELPSNQQ